MFLNEFDMDTYLEGIALTIFQTCILDNQIRISVSVAQQTVFLTGPLSGSLS